VGRRETVQSGPGSRALVVDVIRSSGPVSRVELVEATGLTQPTISNIVRGLIADGVVRETGATVATGGKPRTLLAINSRVAYGVGIHVGMDADTCVVTNTRGGMVGRQLIGPAIGADLLDPVSRLADLCRSTIDMLGLAPDSVAGVTIAGRGLVDVEHGSLASAPSASGEPGGHLGANLADNLGLPVLVASNAAAATVGEFWVRQVSRERTFGCLYMGTGISSGVMLDGALHRGASSNAGQIGHVTVVRDGAACPCGNRGCLDLYAAPLAVVAHARAMPGLTERLGIGPEETPTFAFDILARAALYDDEEARIALGPSLQLLAECAVTLVNLWDLDTLVLAGPGFAVAGSLYVQAIRQELAAAAYPRSLHDVQVDLSNNPRDSVAIGGAALILQASVAPGHGPLVSPIPGPIPARLSRPALGVSR
jgi:predicted NBD/HSP70 family sugar kinase